MCEFDEFSLSEHSYCIGDMNSAKNKLANRL